MTIEDLNPNRTTAAYQVVVDDFTEWMNDQCRITQETMIKFAQQMGFELSPKALHNFLRDQASSPVEDVRLVAKRWLYHFLMATHPARPCDDGLSRVPRDPDSDPEGEIPKKRITRAEAAGILNVSRSTFNRLVDAKNAESASLRRQLGYSGTNSRNGRYSCENVLDYAIQEHPSMMPRSLAK